MRAPLKTPAWEANNRALGVQKTNKSHFLNFIGPFAKKILLRIFCFQKTLRSDNLLPSALVREVAL